MSFYFQLLQAFKAKGRVEEHAYTPQFRLEPIARDPDNDDSLAMRTADPLWMLGRQWQFGEFVGEDNGSPLGAQANFIKRKTSQFSANSFGPRGQIDDKPVEVLVEAMRVLPDDFRTQIKLGEQLKRLIRKRLPTQAGPLIRSLQQHYPIAVGESINVDENSDRFQLLMRGKGIDGNAILYPEQETASLTDRDPNLAAIIPLVQEVKTWFERLYQQPSPSNGANGAIDTWVPEQLVHKFQIHADLPDAHATLNAPDYQSGNFDWYSFDTASVELYESGEDTPFQLPINLSFPGMPKKRLFTFEDNQVDLGNMDIYTEDLIRMMMIEFSLFSGSDWFTLPMPMEVGDLCWINHVVVKDVFGVCTKIENGSFVEYDFIDYVERKRVGPVLGEQRINGKPTGLDVWDVFKIRNRYLEEYNKSEHFLYLAPTIAMRQESEPIEEVIFMRDEYSNMIWGIENKVRNKLGQTVDGLNLHTEVHGPMLPIRAADRPDPEGRPKYRLASTVPYNWIPYLIRSSNPTGLLERAYMPYNVPEGPSDDSIIAFAHLTREEITFIREEAVPSSGRKVQLTDQRARGANGETYIWRGRKIRIGKGEGNSGLRFDYLLDQ